MSRNDHFVTLMRNNGVELTGKTLLDVGFGDGDFIEYAQRHGALEVWGVDYNPLALKEVQSLPLNNETQARCLHMPFSEMPEKRPDLKGKFDIIKITAVTGYANKYELEHMAETAHFLLKKDGRVVVELPAVNLMDRVYKANQTPETSIQIIETLKGVQRGSKLRHEASRLQTAYKQLFQAYFDSSTSVQDSLAPILFLGNPKTIIPDISDIQFDTTTLRLRQIPGQTPVAQRMA